MNINGATNKSKLFNLKRNIFQGVQNSFFKKKEYTQ